MEVSLKNPSAREEAQEIVADVMFLTDQLLLREVASRSDARWSAARARLASGLQTIVDEELARPLAHGDEDVQIID